jgi:hypothetical protein
MGGLTILFVGLKLGGVIDWDWLWVLAPLWLPIVAVIGIFLASVVLVAIGASIYYLCGALAGYLSDRKRTIR